MSFQDQSAFFCPVTGFKAPLCQHITALVLMCHTQGFFTVKYNIKEKVTDATNVVTVMGLDLPSLSRQETVPIVGLFGSRTFPFPLFLWLLVLQVSPGPPCSHTDGWGSGGLGRGAEEFWFGIPRAPRQPGGKEGSAAGAKHNVNMDCFFWKGGNPGATTEALLCCWDNSAMCCVLPQVGPVELGQHFTELGNDLWAML